MVPFTFVLLLVEVLLTGASWGMVALWVSTGFCGVGEYEIFFGLWLASLVVGICTIGVSWGSQVKILSALMLLILFGVIMSWVEYGGVVVSVCPLTGG